MLSWKAQLCLLPSHYNCRFLGKKQMVRDCVTTKHSCLHFLAGVFSSIALSAAYCSRLPLGLTQMFSRSTAPCPCLYNTEVLGGVDHLARGARDCAQELIYFGLVLDKVTIAVIKHHGTDKRGRKRFI